MYKRQTGLSVIWVFFFVQLAEVIKAVIGAVMLRSGIWAKNVVGARQEDQPLPESPVSDTPL